MEIDEIVDFRNRERKPALRGVVVPAVLPERKDGVGCDQSRSLCCERQERGGGNGRGEGCFAHLICLCGVVEAGLLQLRNGCGYSGREHDPVDEMVGQFGGHSLVRA
jgi:hypothetical protein